MKRVIILISVLILFLQSKEVLLNDYKNFDTTKKKAFISKNIANSNDTTDYLNCMGDFIYSKSLKLSAKEVLSWCKNEKANNPLAFYSHINEFQIRKNGSFKNGYDAKIEAIKKAKKIAAQNKVIRAQKENTKQKNSLTKYNTPKEALEALGANFKVIQNKKPNNLILKIGLFANDDPVAASHELRRAFIYGIYIPLIYTKYNKMTITITPYLKPSNKVLKQAIFKATIKREDALKVARQLLNINNLPELIGENMSINGKTTYLETPNKIFKRALYSDFGAPTIDIFFNELTKYAYR